MYFGTFKRRLKHRNRSITAITFLDMTTKWQSPKILHHIVNMYWNPHPPKSDHTYDLFGTTATLSPMKPGKDCAWGSVLIWQHFWILISDWYITLIPMLELANHSGIRGIKHHRTCYYWKTINFWVVAWTPLHARPCYTTLLCFISYTAIEHEIIWSSFAKVN